MTPSTPIIDLCNQLAVVTGAGSGIGLAIASALAAHGAVVQLVGRQRAPLDDLRTKLISAGHQAETRPCDLTRDEEILVLRDRLVAEHGRVDILVHSAGTISLGPIASAPISDFDNQYRINVRAPYLLTQALLPQIQKGQGQIVFVNSSVGLRTKEHVGAYAASKHALKAIADTLRMEINSSGVRVLSVYPGNTATSMQETVQSYAGERIDAEYLLQPADIASTVIHALCLPRTAEVTDIHIRPFKKPPR
jgi:NADP-dependent 3-hydroxy acid dehydrogenase YdfG